MVGMRSVSKRTSRKQPDLRTEEDGPTFPSSEQRSKRCCLHREPIETLASNSVINDTVTVGKTANHRKEAKQNPERRPIETRHLRSRCSRGVP